MTDKPYDQAKTKWGRIALYAIPFAVCYGIMKYLIVPHFF